MYTESVYEAAQPKQLHLHRGEEHNQTEAHAQEECECENQANDVLLTRTLRN